VGVVRRRCCTPPSSGRTGPRPAPTLRGGCGGKNGGSEDSAGCFHPPSSPPPKPEDWAPFTSEIFPKGRKKIPRFFLSKSDIIERQESNARKFGTREGGKRFAFLASSCEKHIFFGIRVCAAKLCHCTKDRRRLSHTVGRPAGARPPASAPRRQGTSLLVRPQRRGKGGHPSQRRKHNSRRHLTPPPTFP